MEYCESIGYGSAIPLKRESGCEVHIRMSSLDSEVSLVGIFPIVLVIVTNILATLSCRPSGLPTRDIW